VRRYDASRVQLPYLAVRLVCTQFGEGSELSERGGLWPRGWWRRAPTWHARTRASRSAVRFAAIHLATAQGRGCGAPTSAVPALVAAGADVNDARCSIFPVMGAT
jgi:hypothetical protein